MVLAAVVYWILTLFLVLLLIRLVMEYVFLLARNYRPGGFAAMALEVCYTVTDPPLKALRRILPPLRLGGISLDLAFLVLFIALSILRSAAHRAAI